MAARAISKANANDPKKSGLTRCARTDKGVHAAGNVISLKLIVDDPDVVHNINSNLSSQIRVWGIERTTGSFSCYHACDSRWYEYLIPTFAFLPPHPNSYLGEQIARLAAEANDQEGYMSRQKEVATFWDDVEAERIAPITETLEDSTRDVILEALYGPSKRFGVTEGGDRSGPARISAQHIDDGASATKAGSLLDQTDASVSNCPKCRLDQALICCKGGYNNDRIRPESRQYSRSCSASITIAQIGLHKCQKNVQDRPRSPPETA